VSDDERAAALLDAVKSKADAKRLASAVDADPALRRAVLQAARQRGVDLPDEALQWPAKKLLRRARGADVAAQRRTNPVARDEAFDCAHCGAAVRPARRTARDHCPRCLHSLHVDVVPGDRAADCGGLLVPVDAVRKGDRFHLTYRCRRCGEERHNRALLDVDDPDDWEALVALTARAGARG
jgi:DNA-directed RNA polymerase subunit RPC12/RpoP